MAGAFNLCFSTPHADYPSQPVVHVDVPAADGRYMFMSRHENCVMALKPGMLTALTSTGETRQWFIPGGIARCSARKLIIMVERLDMQSAVQAGV